LFIWSGHAGTATSDYIACHRGGRQPGGGGGTPACHAVGTVTPAQGSGASVGRHLDRSPYSTDSVYTGRSEVAVIGPSGAACGSACGDRAEAFGGRGNRSAAHRHRLSFLLSMVDAGTGCVS